MLCIAPDMQSALRLEMEVRFYLAGQPDPQQILLFPDREILPYDLFSPHQDLVSDRLRVLYRLPRMTSGLVILPVQTLMHRLAPVDYVESHSLVMKIGDRLDLTAFSLRLQELGYRRVAQVMEHAEYSIRGGLLDLFPMGSETPLRIELFDDEVDSIRCFDPDTQKSTDSLSSVELLPAREFPVTKASLELFYQGFVENFDLNPHRVPLFKKLSEARVMPPGVEFYLPLFFTHTATLFDYLPADALIVSLCDIDQPGGEFWNGVKERFEQRLANRDYPPLAPAKLFLQAPEVQGGMKKFACLKLLEAQGNRGQQALVCRELPDVELQQDSRSSLRKLQDFLPAFPGRVLLVAESAGRQDVLIEWLRRYGLQPEPVAGWDAFVAGNCSLAICHDNLDRGLLLHDSGLAVITENMLYGERVAQRRRRQRNTVNPDALIRNLQELKAGDPVVHVDYGIGRYQGLEALTLNGLTGEYLTLQYADGDRILVPVANLHLIHRYTGGDAQHAPLHKLGSRQWEKARKRAREKARDTAAELLEIHARRAAASGFSHVLDRLAYETFSNEFPFEETVDQAATIESVLQDLCSPRPMNRIVCGDVGFGKTEVAMRAAFVVANAGQQVALLAPTTLLVQQHTENFKNRFANTAIRIASLSRFQSKKEQQEVLQAMAASKVDIVIGTHRLLQNDIHFGNLGLLILDEEQRFGVRHKEQLKKMRAAVDILTLTATPIPRTLNMTLAGLSDLSIIATPPPRRMAVRTFVRGWDALLIREACLREFNRGGQVYFLHNKVETIERIARELGELVPQAKLAVAHGQLSERQLERVMLDFYHQRFNLLVCSTIIESGIDVPSANTIIINRADLLGLAQLHQLRGRVGRSHHQAYAYLMIPAKETLQGDALARLEAIETHAELGIGFILATQDMEIRGAGELLGEGQSGEMHEVGFTLYNELLAETIQQLRDGNLDSGVTAVKNVDIDLEGAALLPEDYVPDINGRLVFYKRISAAVDGPELEELQAELTDRFGRLPPSAKNLFLVRRLGQIAARLGVTRIRGSGVAIQLDFAERAGLDVGRLLHLIQTEPNRYRFNGKETLHIRRESATFQQRIEILEALFAELTPDSLAA